MVKYKAFYAFHLVFLVIEITNLSSGNLFKSHIHKSCDKQRKILTEAYGIISSGGNLYPMDSHCEWLIQGNSSDQFITLHFLKMDTECSYDHIFVYDGDSYSSPMLGSFSGNTTPSIVTGSSGALLILLYSDTNYVGTGFIISYSITDCKLNCSDHGLCFNHQCLCDDLWSGNGCEINLCPNNCSKLEDRGECANSSEGWKCQCKAGYSGIDCSLPDSNKNGGNSWHILSHVEKSFLGRAGHSGVYIPAVDKFYIFGGYTFGRVLGDLIYFEFSNNNWFPIQQDKSPSPRKGHAAVAYGSNFVLYGGELDGRKLSDELWLFNISSNQWKLYSSKGLWPPALTKHSLSLVEDKWLYLFGGNLQNASFSSDMYRINLDNPTSWEKVTYLGGRHSVKRVVGHTAVYHQPSKTIFIFGGVTVEYSHVSKLSNQIHAFHVERKYWTRVNYHVDKNTPLERAFHTAAIVGDYMIVYGGYTHKHSQEEICYDNATHMYHMKCHKWVNTVNLGIDFEGSPNPIRQGVFSHAMGVRHGHTLLIAGGYSGIMRSTFLAYVIPSVIAGGHPLTNPCLSHTSKDGCLANVACGWCFNQKKCKGRKEGKESCTNFFTEPCPGFCSTLSNCHSCLIWGEFAGANVISDGQLIDPFPVTSCAWCVQAMKCHSVHESPPMCSDVNGSSDSKPGSAKWWGAVGTEISLLKKCTTEDFQPGLISIKFRHPINWTQPDDVSYINRTLEDLYLRMEFSKNDSSQVEENVVDFIGYLHPLGAKPLSERMPELQLQMCSVGSSAVLKLSNDTTFGKMEVVANHTAKSSFHCSDVHRKNGAPIFPNTSVGYKYLLSFTVRIPTSVNESSNVQLAWNAFSVQSEVISQDYLEPYKNGSCLKHSNCLSCLTDAACGWCEADSKCYNRLNNPSDCQKYGEIYFLVTQPSDCSICSDYIYCEHCAGVPNCEWLVEVGYCVRRGRFAHAVRKPDLCPTPCHLRTNCSSCLGDPGVCAWCELTQTCFLFSTYTTSYMYGQCRDWVDENRSEPNSNPVFLCRNCSRRKNCRSCLRDLSCGWCSDKENAMEGVCVSGDFSGPSGGNCSSYLEEVHALSPTKPFVWSYSTCPDIEECILGTHNCHQNATCINTLESFSCECNTGFKGDGVTCTRACAVKCVNGHCSEAPDYKCICDLGWTGDDCSINCGCNNHSFCSKEVSICDECKDWTEGQFCEKCMPESYGDAVSSIGCQKCDCNKHGDPDLGFCNTTTGVCYCKDNTEGPNCAKCLKGYYGDPKNGGSCYLECKPRGVITNVQMGKLGSPSRSSHSSDCLWLLTVYPVLDMPSLLPPMTSTDAAIQLVIHGDMKVTCPHNHVYVYDGLPDFIASGHPNVLLGAFCGSNLSSAISVVATSGYLTLHFKRNNYEQSFQATYKRLDCCSSNCQSQEKPDIGYNESICTKDLCPNNCSSSLNQGFCDLIYFKCVCADTYGGDDCSIPLKPHNLIWTSLYDYEDIPIKISSIPSSRMGASFLTVKNDSSKVENIWLFGGYSPASGEMNDMFVFDTLTKHWTKVGNKKLQPPPRFFHASATSSDSIYIYGGISGSEIFGDFWQFNTINGNWTEITSLNLVPMAGSSLTTVRNDVLILIGGFSPNYGFFDKVMEYDSRNDIWISVNCTGVQPIGIYGHSGVYHGDTDSVYIFGGVTYNVDHVSVSGKLYALNYTSKQWFSLPSEIQVSPLKTKPLPRYFHDAVVTKHFMVVFGGRSSNQAKEYAFPFVYIFSCNLWIPLSDKDIEVVGNPHSLAVGTSATVANGDIYIFGGFNGKAIGELKKLSLPDDFCHLFSINRVGCIDHTGCAFCSVYEKGINQTFCYSPNWNRPPSCYNPNGKSEILPGTICNSDWIEKLDCQQYGSCTDCVASWRAFPEAKPVCQWCSNCKAGRCVAIGASCEKENECSMPRKVVDQASVCPSQMCWASDCEKCRSLGMCIWTRQAQRSSGFEHTLNIKPIYNWICVTEEIQDAPPFPIESMPPSKCPAHCSNYINCTSCLESSGGEGGWHECVWSESLHMCMSPSFELLKCEDGSCGPVLQRNSSLCPLPCWKHSQASHCLSHSNCGWCAFTGSKVDGRGLCIAGTIMGPSGGLCRGENQVLLFGHSLPEKVSQWLSKAEGIPRWTYLVKPMENECDNGHHTCDEKHEECVDTVENFECRCKEGYSLKDSQCKPICKQGCVNGTCVSPDECQCNFGYVGNNCSIPCKCNGHSDCPGPDKLSDCIKCLNNTQGPECQKCKPFFVGNPVNGGKCIPCSTYCNGHSSICFTSDFIANNNASLIQPVDQTTITELLEKVKEGALDDAECWACQNNTEGKRCDKCISGYFKSGDSIEDGCRLCECHGHGDMCNHLNGENCNCQNNTENDRQCSQKNMKNIITPCWQLQCSKCKEYFLGAPAFGHQCYRHMFLDKDYCFDPSTQDECNRKPNPLLQGRTVFFAVQPRYMNVDIRIVVDVTDGGIDFFLSAKEDTFVVDVNKTSGIHYISIDRKYAVDIGKEFDFVYNMKSKTKRETLFINSSWDFSNSSDIIASTLLQLREANANGLTTYVTVRRHQEFLLIKNLKNRLVITIPQEVHDLRSTRFYMVLRGVGTEDVSMTYGNLFFRQDQTRIDLFVFFSVFFSCFFLFLAICVVIWKVKQAFDVRRARRLHAAEMKHMASRPFGHITVIDEDSDEYDFTLYSPTNFRKKSKPIKTYGRDSPKVLEDKFGIHPVAIEPASDGIGAVATILIQLPGGKHSLVKMTLASALITTRSSHHHVGYGLRAAMRRRTSHANV